MINSYAPSFKNIYNRMPTWMMCEEMSLCSKNKSSAVQQLSNVNCLKGVEYWCASSYNAIECKVIIELNCIAIVYQKLGMLKIVLTINNII